jgi:hypothetical protein
VGHRGDKKGLMWGGRRDEKREKVEKKNGRKKNKKIKKKKNNRNWRREIQRARGEKGKD